MIKRIKRKNHKITSLTFNRHTFADHAPFNGLQLLDHCLGVLEAIYDDPNYGQWK